MLTQKYTNKRQLFMRPILSQLDDIYCFWNACCQQHIDLSSIFETLSRERVALKFRKLVHKIHNFSV